MKKLIFKHQFGGYGLSKGTYGFYNLKHKKKYKSGGNIPKLLNAWQPILLVNNEGQPAWKTDHSYKSKVLQSWNKTGEKPKPESSSEYTKRRVLEENNKKTWLSDAADISHGIGEGVIGMHPYTAIPYFGAKVMQDISNGNVGMQTAFNAAVPLFHMAPKPVSIPEAANKGLKDLGNDVLDGIDKYSRMRMKYYPYNAANKIISKTNEFFKDAAEFLRTPISENPIKTVKATKIKRTSYSKTPNVEDVTLPPEVAPNSSVNPLDLLRSRYKFAYENDFNGLFKRYNKRSGIRSYNPDGYYGLREPVYKTNLKDVKIQAYTPIRDAWKYFDDNRNTLLSPFLRFLDTWVVRPFTTAYKYRKANSSAGILFDFDGKPIIQINPYYLKSIGYDRHHTLAHELVHALDKYTRPSATFIDAAKLRPKIVEYFNLNLNTELAARGSQIKNYFGITDNSPITTDMLKYAAKNYVKDVKMNNNMNEMFNAITDWDEAARWFSAYSLKKGGKTHKPFGHRSILDNGWQSTKLLKNKKNVYGR